MGAELISAPEWLRRNPGVLSRNNFYWKLKDGTIPSLKIGKRILVRADVLNEMYQALHG